MVALDDDTAGDLAVGSSLELWPCVDEDSAHRPSPSGTGEPPAHDQLSDLRGELRVWGNEVLMGWYIATEGAVCSQGTMYFALHQHGQRMTGRWVGLSYHGPIITGWAAIARTEEEVIDLLNHLREDGAAPT
jgi:hypothetical protein